MGEMEDGIAIGEDKVQPATSSNPGLQVSVSFGRFENDSLSWEKFSAFSPNKYLEEVEKCATPGSVAQKKAYFEAHYKKIAERKAELMDQEKQMEKKASFRSSGENHGDPSSETGGSLAVSGVNGGSNGQCTIEEDKHVTDIATEVNNACIHERDEETLIVKECQTSVHGVTEECRDGLDSTKLERPDEVVRVEEKPEDVVLVEEEVTQVKEEIPSMDSDGMNETPMQEMKKEHNNNNLTKTKDGNARMNRARGSPKTNPVNKKPITSKGVTNRKTLPNKERSATMATKKPASPLSKSQVFSTPRVSKPASTLTSMSTSRSLVKKENVSTLPRNKQTAPKSLHLSLSLGPPGSDPTALATTRKSLIMERMGDKDIVKRAFKTFQKSFNQSQSSTDGQSTAPKQVPAKAKSVSALTTTPKESGRPAKAGCIEKKSANTYRSPSSGLKSNVAAEKQKELSKISREKSGAKGAERTRLQAKPKAGMTDVKTRRHSLDPKSKPMQGTLPLPALSKGSPKKDDFTK